MICITFGLTVCYHSESSGSPPQLRPLVQERQDGARPEASKPITSVIAREALSEPQRGTLVMSY